MLIDPEQLKKMMLADLTSGYGRSMTALVKEMSRDLKGNVKVEQGWPPSWNPKTNTVKLPFFVNADLLSEEDLHDGRSFIGHESGEKEFNELDPADDRWKHKQMLKTIVNIVGDARINLKQEEKYPGFKRSHAFTCQSFLKDFTKQAQQKEFDPDPQVDDCRAYAVALCLAEFAWEGQVAYSDIMRIPDMNPKVEGALKVLKPFIDQLHPETMSCDEIADESERIYNALKCYDIPEDKQDQAFPEEFGEGEGEGTGEGGEGDSVNGGWGNTGGRDYGKNLANALGDSKDAPLGSGDNHGRGDVQTYTFDPHIDKWVTYEDTKEAKAGTYKSTDLDRLAMVLANRLTKLLQTPAPVTQRYQTTGRLDGSRIASILQYRGDVFKRKIIAEDLDVAVALSVDCSSSMSTISADVRAAISTWTKALGLVGIPHEILGWQQRGWWGYNQPSASQLPANIATHLYRYSPITWQVIKAFHEDYKAGIYRTRYEMTFAGGTPSGEGISVPGWRLMQRKEPRKILFVFTDGAPALACNGPYEVHEEYIKESVRSLRMKGVEVVGVALNRGCYGSVQDMFDVEASLCVDGIGELMTKQGNAMLRSVVGRAEQRGAR